MILDIVVDVQKDFITGALANPQAQANVTHLGEPLRPMPGPGTGCS